MGMAERNRRMCGKLVLLATACVSACALASPGQARPGETATAPGPPSAAVPPGARKVDQGWFAPQKRSAPPKQPKSVFIIPIREQIMDKAFKALERKVLQCRSGQADLVILDMDTPGGSVNAAEAICKLINSGLGKVHTVCFIRSDALSAGAMIALACKEIIVTPGARLGATAPLVPGMKLEKPIREKFESVLRTQLEQSAERNGYPKALAVSMVSRDLEVWLIRSRRTGELRYVLRADWRGRVKIPPGLADVDSNPEAQWDLLEVPVRKDRLLTMTAEKAKAYRFASAILDAPKDRPYEHILKRYNVKAQPTVLIDSWSEDMVDIIRSPVVAAILVFLAMMFGYVEMHTPGFGLFGGLAIACFVILIGSGYLVGLAQVWEIALFVLGLVLIAVEVFVTPGFGVLGISGAVCCLFAAFAMLVGNAPSEFPWPKTELDHKVLLGGIRTVGIGFVAAVIAGAILSRFLPKIPLARRIILAPPAPAGGPPVPAGSAMTRVQVGDVGLVESMCRPVGKVRFGDDLLDAVSEGDTIQRGAKVRVQRRDGNRIIVEKV